MISTGTPPVSGSDDARCTDTKQSREDRDRALKKAQEHFRSALDGGEMETQSHRLAQEYLRLGGHRRSKIDDNITTVRHWEDDPPEAEQFWKEQIETLPTGDRKQVEIFLPTINSP
ncbi:hypothetical protein DTW90_33415 [Neorhizobium sp. P12A]|nr:hypothetical protein DTW90_33415 [Neorhizobium sp. P12A]